MDYATFSKVVTDSRLPMDGDTVFVAIKGERFDGHDFLRGAVESGAGALLVSDRKKVPANCKIPVFAVEDTVTAYQEIARNHRRRFKNLTVIGVTGSVGKTSVKEMLRAVFSAAAGPEHVLYTLGNTNNQIGVPQNLMRLNENIRYAIIEMGTNHPGEIAPLARCAEPDAALVNSIAPCHLENLRDLAGVAEEKGHIFDFLPRPGGIAVIPANAPERALLEKAAAGTRRFFAGEDIRAEYSGGGLEGSRVRMRFPGRTLELEWALSGAHQCGNAVNAATLAFALGISPELIVRGLSQTVLPGGRMKKTFLNGATYLNDAYNANPSSMKSALDALVETGREKDVVAVLGDMFELGEDSLRYHREVLEYAVKKLPRARLIAVGDLMSEAAKGLPVECFGSTDALGDILKVPQAGKVVFVKASHGMHLEKALPEEAV